MSTTCTTVIVEEPFTTVDVECDEVIVSVTEEFVTVEIDCLGIQGPPGPQGPPGSSGSDIYDHVQSSASATWTVNHNLGVKPDVEVRNTGGQVVGAEVVHVSVNQTIIYFSLPMTGSAHFG